ncbi:hypothetical protein [Diaphorobacter caeni]|uniref:hypothetical protein n=1 Tax=Diaphorobacter caeni TaxID=2784387 RepID=UPI0018904C55|nr:hypothetical protein [Diaphorobacter caeni]MBF5007083.1 hypothetical protein [Diaphorobacter caeni]
MFHFFKSRTTPALVTLLEQVGGGAHKRVDENRELLELLQSKAPDVLEECPWIVGWLRANDDVFVGMAAMATELRLEPRFAERPGFPRAWPERCPTADQGVSVRCTARLCGLRPVPPLASRPSGSNP